MSAPANTPRETASRQDSDDTPPRYPGERSNYVDPQPVLLSGPPVSPLRFAGGSTGWLVTGFDEARAVLQDGRFSAERWRGDDTVRPVPRAIREAKGNGPGMFLTMDPPEHHRYRSLLTGYFTLRRMRALEPRIGAIVAQCLDAVEAAGRPADLVEHFALPVPSLVICEMLGVPYAERRVFQQASGRLLHQHATDGEVGAARATLDALLADVVRVRRRAPQEDLISLLVSDSDLDDAEIVGISRLLLIAGHETTTNMLSLGTFALLRHPDQMRRLREDDSLVPGAVEELLRYLGIVNAFPVRVALEDVAVGDVLVRAGQSVAVSVPAVNRAPSLVDAPELLDVGRPRSNHLAFGYGIHQCLGQNLARIELAAGYRGLLDRFPGLRLAVPAGDVPMRSDMAVYGAYELPVTW
ncbi:cytochrome P450 [Streptomyces sp. NPDC050560]|uniref:cytochrome P450 n=1 Tax=Streptomyces sp. NPDC050560 TaxID=3365630 RepID=UPI003787779E